MSITCSTNNILVYSIENNAMMCLQKC
jgi:hypothetical protein